MTTFYKVLKDGKSCHGGNQEWSLPKDNGDGTWTPGDWHEAIGPIVVCRNGLHLTTDPMQWPVVGMQVFRAEGDGESSTEAERDGESSIERDKTAFRRARLLSPADDLVPTWWRDVESFVRSIPDTPWMQRTGPVDPEWSIFPTRASAHTSARAHTSDYARAYDSAYAIARSSDYSRAYDSAHVSAYDSAYASASASAYARASARDSAYDSALMSTFLVVADLIAPEHLAYARARWEVWRRGYGLLCDVDGVLYVYEAIT